MVLSELLTARRGCPPMDLGQLLRFWSRREVLGLSEGDRVLFRPDVRSPSEAFFWLLEDRVGL